MKLSYETHFKSQRADGRYTSQLAAHMEMLRRTKPLLRMPDVLTQESFSAWQKAVKAKAAELLCLPEITPQPAPKRIATVQRDGYRVERWECIPTITAQSPF